MGKNIIICSDGTGNTFDSRVTNVTHLIECLALDNHKQQMAVYDQGVGTSAHRCSKVDAYRESLKDKEALRVLPSPIESRFRPKAWLDRGRGLLFGYGLKKNVREMYRELSNLYEGPDDRVFLFGFSRGAFTCASWPGCCAGANCRSLESPTSMHVSTERGNSMSRCLRMRLRSCSFVRSSDGVLFISLAFGTR